MPWITLEARARGEPHEPRVPPSMTDPGLSVCLIVRDAAETLERAVGSVRPHVAELCVYDTGSTDGTIALLERLAAEPRNAGRLRAGRVARRLRVGARAFVRALLAALADVSGRRRRRSRRRAPSGSSSPRPSGPARVRSASRTTITTRPTERFPGSGRTGSSDAARDAGKASSTSSGAGSGWKRSSSPTLPPCGCATCSGQKDRNATNGWSSSLPQMRNARRAGR